MITLHSHALSLSLAPNLGAGIADFSITDPHGTPRALMRRAAPNETNASNLASFFMAPWANRIRNATFSFNNTAHTLRPTSADGMAQHGDVRKRPWRATQSAANSAVLEIDSRDFADANWPWPFACRAIYTLLGTERAGSLRIDLLVRNLGDGPMPAGCGHHPYFMRRLWDAGDDLSIRVPVAARYPVQAGCAVGPPAEDDLTRRLRAGGPVPAEPVDAVFIADSTAPNVAELHWPASRVRMRIRASANLSHWVVFAPHESADRPSPREFIALEPQTQVNDALNLAATGVFGTGTIVLNPREELATTCMFEVEAE